MHREAAVPIAFRPVQDLESWARASKSIVDSCAKTLEAQTSRAKVPRTRIYPFESVSREF
jgi:hypothetical protein